MTTDTLNDAELVPVRALEYSVDADGRVDTAGRYRIVSQAVWESLPPVQRGLRPYAPVVAHLRAGRIVALPARNGRAAWNIGRSLQLNAERAGLSIEVKRCVDPQEQGALLVLARKQDT